MGLGRGPHPRLVSVGTEGVTAHDPDRDTEGNRVHVQPLHLKHLSRIKSQVLK